MLISFSLPFQVERESGETNQIESYLDRKWFSEINLLPFVPTRKLLLMTSAAEMFSLGRGKIWS